MFQKKIIFLLLLLLSSCGYEAIHSKKNLIKYDFSIGDLEFIGDRNINLKIREKLNNYTQNEKSKNFMLKISSTTEKSITAKNKIGEITNFQSTIILSVEVSMNNNFKSSFIITENFTYNNIADKFNLKRYEREIKNNLATTATDRLIFKLSNIQ
mgnify:CR=1 FL=1